MEGMARAAEPEHGPSLRPAERGRARSAQVVDGGLPCGRARGGQSAAAFDAPLDDEDEDVVDADEVEDDVDELSLPDELLEPVFASEPLRLSVR